METVWPLPKFHFQVTWAGLRLSCQEVSGLDAEAQTIEYRHGNSPEFSVIKMPGLVRSSNVTLKKIVVENASAFWNLLEQIRMNTVVRATATIELLDEGGAPKMRWELAKAWPAKIGKTDLTSDGNEAAIETIELAHEGLIRIGS
ncbi:MAG: phage tail protein [Rhodospirillaceae bacterium]